MSSVIERGAAVAGELYERRIEKRSPLRGHETMLRILIAEAFALGAMWGIERAQHAVAITHARYRTELDDESAEGGAP